MDAAPIGPVDYKYLFPVPVMVTKLADAESLNTALAEAIQIHKAQSQGLARSNILGWHSDTEMLKWGGEAAKSLALAMLQLCGSRTDDIGLKGGPPRYEMGMEMWDPSMMEEGVADDWGLF